MDYSQFVERVNLSQRTELEKVRLTAWYDNYESGCSTFSLISVINRLHSIGHPISNVSRLKGYLSKSKDFKKVGKNDDYMIIPAARKKLCDEFEGVINDEELVESSSEILDESLFMGKKNFLDKLVRQINHCYRYNCFDGSAVLMRRLFEITLILSYEHLGIQDQIKKDGDYVMLERIVSNAVNNKTLNISRTRKEYDDIRDLGNFAAHKIYFNTRKSDIDNIKGNYRVCLEELYYKAGLLI